MNKNFFIPILIILFLAGAAWFFFAGPGAPRKEQPLMVSPKRSAAQILADLPNHTTASDCWASYKGQVYNITPLFGQHQGGDQALAAVCGKSADSAFETRGKEPAMPHDDQAMKRLEKLLVQ